MSAVATAAADPQKSRAELAALRELTAGDASCKLSLRRVRRDEMRPAAPGKNSYGRDVRVLLTWAGHAAGTSLSSKCSFIVELLADPRYGDRFVVEHLYKNRWSSIGSRNQPATVAGLRALLAGLTADDFEEQPEEEEAEGSATAGLSTVTAGDLKGYIAKLAKLSKEAMQTRIANIKRKQKLVSKMLDSGKFTSASKPGPKTAAQAKYVARGLANALKWHEEALSMQGKVATAGEDREVATNDIEICLSQEDKDFMNLWVPKSAKSELKSKITALVSSLGGGTRR